MDVWFREGLWVQNSPLLFSLKTSFLQKLCRTLVRMVPGPWFWDMHPLNVCLEVHQTIYT